MAQDIDVTRNTSNIPIGSTSNTDITSLINRLYEWFEVPGNYSLVHFAIEEGMSKDELMEKGSCDDRLKRAIDYALSVQEYKVVQGALDGSIDKIVALEMLKTYAGWGKKDKADGSGTVLALPEGDWIMALKKRVHGRQGAVGDMSKERE